MIEILQEELKVLNCLVHAESIETVMQETGLSAKVSLDILRTLVHYRFLKVVDLEGRELKMFSPDRLKKVRFILTARGFESLEKGGDLHSK